MAEVRLTKEQQAAVELQGGSLLVSAAAGSGKTKVLVERLLDRVAGPQKRDIDEFLVITYTRAAAQELRSRIVAELTKRISENPGDSHLRRQSLLVYKTKISTIHSFCSSVIRENAHLLDIVPDFRVLDEQDAASMLQKALEDLLEKKYEAIDKDGDFKALVDTLGSGRDDSRLISVVLEAYKKVRSHRDPSAWARQAVDNVEQGVDTAQNELMAAAAAILEYWLKMYEGYLSEMLGDEKLETAYLPAFSSDKQWIEETLAALGRGWNAAVQCFPLKAEKLGGLRNYEDEHLKERLKAGRARFKKAAEKLGAFFETTQEENCRDGEVLAPVIRGLFGVTGELEEIFRALKVRRKGVDYGDLEHMMLRLLYDNGEYTDIARQLSNRFFEVLVDEYQDSNRVQNAIFTAVSDDGAKLFMVGDVKQSIYRFNLADPGIFLEKYRSFQNYEDCAYEGRKVLLSSNFRSRPQVTDPVNRLFSDIMSTRLGEMEYGSEESLISAGTFPENAGTNCEINVVSLGSMDTGEEKMSRSRGEALCVARRIRELIDSGFMVTGNDGELRPIQQGDIVILMRSPGSRTAEYMAALEQCGLSGCADGGEGLLGKTEVSVIVSYLEILDNPHQDVHLVGVLRSPLWNFPPSKLAEIRACARKSDLYDALCLLAQTDRELKKFVTSLEKLRFEASDMTSSAIVRKLYADTDALAVFSALPAGKSRRENLLMFFKHAIEFENRGHTTLFSFLNALRRMQERGKELSGAPVSGTDAVRIMSVHKSKGLEFPVVVLADVMKQFNRDDLRRPVLIHSDLGAAARIHDSDRMIEYPTVGYKMLQRKLENEMLSEEMRILYVAMTRPKDKLIIFTSAKDPAAKMKTLAEQVSLPLDENVLEEVNCVGDWILLSALMRPEADILRSLAGTPCPVRDMGDSPVVFRLWEQLPQESGPAQKELETREITGEEFNLSSFVYPHLLARDIPSKITATEIKKHRGDGEKLRQHFEKPAFLKKEKKLTGTDKGTAVHLAMQYLDYDKCTDAAAVAAEIQRLVDLQYITSEQGQAVEPEKLMRFFDSSVGQLIKSADKVHREFKFSILVPAQQVLGEGGEEQLLLQGVVDCYLETSDGITVIDFKSDAVTVESQPTRAKSYEIQISAYADALARITGRPVTRKILYFFAMDSWEEM